MPTLPRIVAVSADDWPVWRILRLAALADAPHAYGSRLADWQGAGDTEVRWRARLEAVPLNLVAYDGTTPVAMVSGDRGRGASGTVCELLSLWVTPAARGSGLSDALVTRVVEWSVALGAERLQLNVRLDNQPAIRLYRRHGFIDQEIDPEQAPGDPPELCMTKSLG